MTTAQDHKQPSNFDTSDNDQQSFSHFLGLPPELRYQIYEHLYHGNTIRIQYEFLKSHDSELNASHLRLKHAAALLRTCRTCHVEASELFQASYQTVDFRLRVPERKYLQKGGWYGGFSPQIEYFTDFLDSEVPALIRQNVTHLATPELKAWFGPGKQGPAWLSHLYASMPNLKTIELRSQTANLHSNTTFLDPLVLQKHWYRTFRGCDSFGYMLEGRKDIFWLTSFTITKCFTCRHQSPPDCYDSCDGNRVTYDGCGYDESSAARHLIMIDITMRMQPLSIIKADVSHVFPGHKRFKELASRHKSDGPIDVFTSTAGFIDPCSEETKCELEERIRKFVQQDCMRILPSS